MKLESLPKRIDKIDVCLGKKALGLLTNSSVHHYQPSQIGQYVSLTMTRPVILPFLTVIKSRSLLCSHQRRLSSIGFMWPFVIIEP